MPKNSKKILSGTVSIIIIMFSVIPFLIRADDTTVTTPGTNTTVTTPSGSVIITNPLKGVSNIPDFINSIIKNILMPIGGVIAVLMIMYAGFLYVTARGNETKIGEAKNALTWAIIGAAILIGAFVISQAISATITQLQAG